MSRHFYLFYGDAPRTLQEHGETADEWIERERRQKEFIGQELRPDEEENLRKMARKEDPKDE